MRTKDLGPLMLREKTGVGLLRVAHLAPAPCKRQKENTRVIELSCTGDGFLNPSTRAVNNKQQSRTRSREYLTFPGYASEVFGKLRTPPVFWL